MTAPFPQLWANASTDRRAPSTSELANGFPCGAADPDLFDFLFYRGQQVSNRLAGQIEYAAQQKGITWLETDEAALDKVLKTYQDIITENTVLNVPADYDDIADAMDYLSAFRIDNNATVIINVAAGVYNHGTKVVKGHPDGLRVKVQGPALPSGMPTEGNFQVTGFSTANIASDRIVNESMLRGRFPVIIQTTNGGVDTGTGDIQIENVLFIGSGANEGIRTLGGRAVLSNVAVHNYAANYKVDRAGVIEAPNCTGSGAVIEGWNVTNGGVIFCDGAVASGNGSSGFVASVGGAVIATNAVSKGNGGTDGAGFFVSLSGIIQARGSTSKTNENCGYLITNDGFIQARESTAANNGSHSYSIFNGGRLNAASTNSTGAGGRDYNVQNFGGMTATGFGGDSDTSPAFNTVGNGNGYIKN